VKIRFPAFFLLFVSPVTAFADDVSVAGLSWMAGCWSYIGAEPGSGEQWMNPAAGSMLGMSRTVNDGETVAFEFLRIAEDDEGIPALFALPSGQSATTFTLLRQSDNEVVFANPGHDFPQRVIYRLTPGPTLIGRIEGTVNGEVRSVDFPMKRIDCETGDSA
jgi:Domain of unknown function (DUF6265)